jgi:hypothetical protein
LQDLVEKHTDISLTDSRYFLRWELISLDEAVAASEKSARVESWTSKLNRLYLIAQANDDKFLMRTIKWRLECLSSRQNSRLGLTDADLVPDTIYESWAEGQLSIGQGHAEEAGKGATKGWDIVHISVDADTQAQNPDKFYRLSPPESREYNDALQAASLRGHEKEVEMLIERGADVNAQRGSHGNLLQAASFGGNRSTLPKKLIVCCDGESTGCPEKRGRGSC